MTYQAGSRAARAAYQLASGEPVVTLVAERPRDTATVACQILADLLAVRRKVDVRIVARDMAHHRLLIRQLLGRIKRAGIDLEVFLAGQMPSDFFLRQPGTPPHVLVVDVDYESRTTADLIVVDSDAGIDGIEWLLFSQVMFLGEPPSELAQRLGIEADGMATDIDRQITWGPMPTELILAGAPE